MELPFDPAIPFLGLYPKNPETLIQKNLCTPVFIAAQFTIAKFWKQLKFPLVNQWIKKLWYIYTMEYYTAERNKELIQLNTRKANNQMGQGPEQTLLQGGHTEDPQTYEKMLSITSCKRDTN